MRNIKRTPWIAVLLALLMTTALILSACTVEEAPTENTATPEVTLSPTQEPTDAANSTAETFSYSNGIDQNGYWEGLKALDYVKLPELESISIPADIHEITEEELQAAISELLSDYLTDAQVTDRPVADGDTVNIDYVGSVDGVEFENGSTNNAGTDVTIGVTSYIDDFLEQLIGHTPGENFDIQVTFPDPYTNNTDLSGKEAVFNITINYITEKVIPELTDEFIVENLTADNGWTTVEEMRTKISEDMERTAIFSYIRDYLFTNSTVSSVPDSLIIYQIDSMIAYFQEYADMYSVSLEEFLKTYVGFDSLENLLTSYADDQLQQATQNLIMQAVAEKIGLSVDLQDVNAYFTNYVKTDDYSSYENTYGMPFLKQTVLYQSAIEYITENAILE